MDLWINRCRALSQSLSSTDRMALQRRAAQKSASPGGRSETSEKTIINQIHSAVLCQTSIIHECIWSRMQMVSNLHSQIGVEQPKTFHPTELDFLDVARVINAFLRDDFVTLAAL